MIKLFKNVSLSTLQESVLKECYNELTRIGCQYPIGKVPSTDEIKAMGFQAAVDKVVLDILYAESIRT